MSGYSSYQEVLDEKPTVSRCEAVRELELHAADVNEFFEDCGDKQSYKALDVLHWLGY